MNDQLQEIRKRLNYYRRMERQLVKAIQRACRHQHYKQMIIKQVLPPLKWGTDMYESTQSISTVTHTKIVCQDCGKRLN